MAKKGPFKMKGHTLPGINQRSETTNMGDGRSKSSAFQANAATGAKAGKGSGLGSWASKTGGNMKANFAKSNLGKDLKSVDSKLQGWGKKHSDWKANRMSKSKINIKDKMSKKYGTGDYAKGGSKANQRMNPGESQYKYDIRMKKQANKAKKSMIDKNKDNISDLIQPTSITNPAPKGQGKVSSKTNVNKPKGSNLDKMSFGEYVDIDTYINDNTQLHKAMAVLFRPISNTIGNTYKIQKYKGSDKFSEAMLDTPVNIALGAINFILRLQNELAKATLASSQKKVMLELEQAHKQTSEESMAGFRQFTLWLKKMQLKSMMQ